MYLTYSFFFKILFLTWIVIKNRLHSLWSDWMISVENFNGNIYKNIENAIIEAEISKNELADKLKIFFIIGVFIYLEFSEKTLV